MSNIEELIARIELPEASKALDDRIADTVETYFTSTRVVRSQRRIIAILLASNAACLGLGWFAGGWASHVDVQTAVVAHKKDTTSSAASPVAPAIDEQLLVSVCTPSRRDIGLFAGGTPALTATSIPSSQEFLRQ